jgi:hypothetical protein
MVERVGERRRGVIGSPPLRPLPTRASRGAGVTGTPAPPRRWRYTPNVAAHRATAGAAIHALRRNHERARIQLAGRRPSAMLSQKMPASRQRAAQGTTAPTAVVPRKTRVRPHAVESLLGRLTMRTLLFTVLAGTLTFLGCRQAESPAIQTVDSTKALAGIWHLSFGRIESDEGLRIELLTNGLWKAWSLEKGTVTSPAVLAGPWFVHDRTLVLRVQGTNNGHLLPGSALTFDLEDVTSRSIKMSSLLDTVAITLERLAQQDGAANGSQPVRPETNSPSSAAGSRR